MHSGITRQRSRRECMGQITREKILRDSCAGILAAAFARLPVHLRTVGPALSDASLHTVPQRLPGS